MGWYLRNWEVYEFDIYLTEISIKNPNFWYMSRVTAFKTEMRLLAVSTVVLTDDKIREEVYKWVR